MNGDPLSLEPAVDQLRDVGVLRRDDALERLKQGHFHAQPDIRGGDLDATLQAWSQGVVGERSFQQLTEDFADRIHVGPRGVRAFYRVATSDLPPIITPTEADSCSFSARATCRGEPKSLHAA